MKLGSLFTGGAVLQRKQPIAVWGETLADVLVRAEIGGLRVFFDYADGLELRGLPGKSFYLAGADGAFYPADKAEISGGSILLTLENVKAPLYVRYAWSDNPESILWNRQYPAAAFCSD